MPKNNDPDMKVSLPWADADKPPPAQPGAPPSLLEPEHAPAYNAYVASPSPKNATALLTSIHPILTEAVRSYAGSEVGSATTMANAKSLALQAVGRYDPSRAKLRTHLLSHLRGLRRQTSRASGGVYYPEATRIDAQRLDAALPDLRDDLGREPSTAELADHLGIDMKRIEKARGVSGVLTGSQMADTGFAAKKVDPAAWDTWLKIVHVDSNPIDQVILEHSFGLFGKPILSGGEIAKKLRLSPGAISQRRARLQSSIDEYDAFLGRKAE